MSERKDGWYWLKVDEEEWEPGEWHGSVWRVKETQDTFEDWELIEIGPRIPTPGEPWQCVPKEATPDMMEFLTIGHCSLAANKWRGALAVAPSPDDHDA